MNNENNVVAQPVVEPVSGGTVVQNTPPMTSNPYQPLPIQSVPYYPAPQPVPKKPPREYSAKENTFAWSCYILAFLFTLTIPINENPLGLLVVIVLMFVMSTAMLIVKGKKLQLMPLLVGISALVMASSLIRTSNAFLHFFTFLYAMVAYCYYVYGMSSEHRFRFSDFILVDFVKALFVLPFSSFSDMFVSMFSGKVNKGGRYILKVVVGLIIAVVPTMIIFSLLSYDKGFSEIINKIFDFKDFNIFEYLLKLLLALPFGAYAYGIYISSVDKKCENSLTAQSCKATMVKMRFAPSLSVVAAIVPILFIYIVFFVSQWQYYISGFTGVLPKGFSYAQYAREGFFQLCTVSVINLVILTVISLFLKRSENKPSVILKLIAIVFSVFTLVLISTALAKMVMYIDCYGLTPKRVYATWFMCVLAVVFVLVIIKQFTCRLKLIALSMVILVLMFTALTLCGVESIIAQYNVDRYIDGTLKTVDIDAMKQLGDPAVPQLVRLYNEMYSDFSADWDEAKKSREYLLYTDVCATLKNKCLSIAVTDEYSIWSFTVPSLKAEKALSTTPFYSEIHPTVK